MKIIQIMPTGGWRAVVEDEGKPIAFDLACWALVEEDGETDVVGLDATSYIDTIHDISNFISYLAPGDDVHKFDDEAKEMQSQRELAAMTGHADMVSI